ncbi:hypothetical protein [Halobacillus halophilus]|uniref:hypothetical protein n=1 Tax=Halobacillus halophilus TaxID=1570 RepID=UPI001CD4CCF2|nr:hypothetical protein [Halobacillus halophilus]MCA1011597.1 hypothetical protein [Halobacillus halophilus]
MLIKISVVLSVIMIVFGMYLSISDYPRLNYLGILFVIAGIFSIAVDWFRNRKNTG